jgi:hypothetical protein
VASSIRVLIFGSVIIIKNVYHLYTFVNRENIFFFAAKQIPDNITIYTAKAMPKLQNLLDFFKIYDTI